MKKILITGIGGDIAQGAASIIKDAFPSWHIIGSDTNIFHAGKLFVDTFLQSPDANDIAYLQWVEKIIKENSVDFLWPLSEAEILVLTKEDKIGINLCPVISSGTKAVQVGNDKLNTIQFLNKIGLPAPWTLLHANQLSDNDFPCIYKPRFSSGSKSIFMCSKIEQANFFSENFPGGVFQELLLPHDKEVTCGVYRSNTGDIAVLPLLRRLTDSLTGWAQVIENDDVVDQCEKLATALDLRGTMNVQLRLTESGPRIFEINPRISSTGYMRHLMGYKDGFWSLKEAMGEKVDLFVPPKGLTAVRVGNPVILD